MGEARKTTKARFGSFPEKNVLWQHPQSFQLLKFVPPDSILIALFQLKPEEFRAKKCHLHCYFNLPTAIQMQKTLCFFWARKGKTFIFVYY